MKKNLIFFLPNFSSGGAGKSIFNICKNLKKKKYSIYILSITKNFYKKDFLNLGAEVVELNTNSTIFSLNKIKVFFENFDKKNTIIISNINYANALFVIYFKIINKFKLVLIERTPYQELNIYNNLNDLIKKFIIKLIIRYFYKKADEIICNSKKISDDFTKVTKKKCKYIYPLTINKILKINKKSIPKKSKINILSISRLSWEKNLFDQIKAIKILKKKNIVLNILGDGILKNEYKRFIKKNRIRCNIISYSDFKKEKFFKKSHIYICSSLFEGFPNAVVEAINYNLPIISSKSYGGINEIILNGKGGQFYKINDDNNLAQKIIKTIKNYEFFLRKTLIAKKQLNRFSNKNIRNYEYVFDKV